MPGDENLSREKQAEIAVLTQQWDAANSKGDTTLMNNLHLQAEAIRARQDAVPTPESDGSDSPAYQQWQQITAGWPPTPYTILVGEIAKIAPLMPLSAVLKTADAWVIRTRVPAVINSMVEDLPLGANASLIIGLGSVKIDIGKGWTARIDSDRSGAVNGRQHIHIYNGKYSYAQNDDGSPHDGSSGSPPKKVLKAVNKETGWDWQTKEKSWIDKIDIIMDASGAYYELKYPDGRKISVVQDYTISFPFGSRYPTTEQMIKYYSESDDIIDTRITPDTPRVPTRTDLKPLVPMIEPIPIPVPAPAPLPITLPFPVPVFG
jgi:hypothetical protein